MFCDLQQARNFRETETEMTERGREQGRGRKQRGGEENRGKGKERKRDPVEGKMSPCFLSLMPKSMCGC